jgi:transcriptional regulator with XRE-family HTH domain
LKHLFQGFKLIDLSQISTILKERVKAKGGNQSEIARALGISSQRLNQYINGRMKPKVEFYDRWKEVFGEDLKGETNVSGISGAANGSSSATGYLSIGKPLTYNDYIDDMRRMNKVLENLLYDRINKIDANLVRALAGVTKQSVHMEAVSGVALEALARIEKKKPDALRREADKRVLDTLSHNEQHHRSGESGN